MIENVSLKLPGTEVPVRKNAAQNEESIKIPQTNEPEIKKGYTATSLVNAYQAFHGINSKHQFKRRGMADVFNDLNQQMTTCRDREKGKEGEEVGQQVKATKILMSFYDQIPNIDDAIKTTVPVSENGNMITEARTQIKRTRHGMLYEMALRQPHKKHEDADLDKPLQQKIQIFQDVTDHKREPKELAYVLNTRGKLMSVTEDANNVILTNSGKYTKKYTIPGERFSVNVKNHTKSAFDPFDPGIQEVRERIPGESKGKGTEIVIGMEDGRFVAEIINSIEEFTKKVNDGEIVLDPFVANSDNTDSMQLVMLAGGFGSRAEYTNASSSYIFHDKDMGAQSTKGVFRTATGLTPMETTFITLHNAGLLDCSKGNLAIGKNIKFYLNKSGVNKGNGGFTVDVYENMKREGRNSLMMFPNDSMSRLTEATKEVADIMNTGEAAIAMIAKEISSEDAKGNFGIMKLGDNNEIMEFAEKPKVIPEGYEHNGKCLTNTFQFAVSKEAFGALAEMEPFFASISGKESRDWSKTFIPVLMSLTQHDTPDTIIEDIAERFGCDKENIPRESVIKAKNLLGNQKIIAVPTKAPWADCGTLDALYHTTMQIANNDFPLEDFERKHVLDSINPKTGLVASTPEQKTEIETKYDVQGEVMAVPKAKKVDPSIIDKYIRKGLITVNKAKRN